MAHKTRSLISKAPSSEKAVSEYRNDVFQLLLALLPKMNSDQLTKQPFKKEIPDILSVGLNRSYQFKRLAILASQAHPPTAIIL